MSDFQGWFSWFEVIIWLENTHLLQTRFQSDTTESEVSLLKSLLL